MDSKLIADLKEEHRTIERLLASLLRLTVKASIGDSYTKPLLERHLELFRCFLDALHHGREEELLFKAMNAAGMPFERGPLSVMLAEHEQGRNHVAALGQVASGAGTLSLADFESLRHYASAFVETLSAHIAKEEGVLYPMAEARLGAEGIARLDDQALTWISPLELGRGRLLADAELLCESSMVQTTPPPARVAKSA